MSIMFYVLSLIDIHTVTIMNSTVPIFALILSNFVFGEIITKIKLLCIIMSISGVILIVDPSLSFIYSK